MKHFQTNSTVIRHHASITTSIFIVFLSLNSNGSVADSTVERVFRTIHYLENLYYNEHLTYAPDLWTLKNSFQVKDTIEFFIPGYEINIGIRDNKPLLSAISENGDSIVQVGNDTLYRAILNQSEYCIDNHWRINPNETSIILIRFEPAVDLRAEITGRGKLICSFMCKFGRSQKWKIEGCTQFVSIDSSKSTPYIKVSLPTYVLKAGHWKVIMSPSSKVTISGKCFSEKTGHFYPIKGSASKDKPFSIFSKFRNGGNR